jgi:hypothetical protein
MGPGRKRFALVGMAWRSARSAVRNRASLSRSHAFA